jgi:hypothetical protein
MLFPFLHLDYDPSMGLGMLFCFIKRLSDGPMMGEEVLEGGAAWRGSFGFAEEEWVLLVFGVGKLKLEAHSRWIGAIIVLEMDLLEMENKRTSDHKFPIKEHSIKL